MNLPAHWIVEGVFLALLVGLCLRYSGRGMRQHRGLGNGQTISLDRVTLTSHRFGLVGRPDRLIRTGGVIIPEEWKSARMLRPWHQAQMGVYFLLLEERFGLKPPHGFLVCGDGTRHQIDNTAELRAWVLYLAEQIRSARKTVSVVIPVNPTPCQCRPCGMRSACGQAR